LRLTLIKNLEFSKIALYINNEIMYNIFEQSNKLLIVSCCFICSKL